MSDNRDALKIVNSYPGYCENALKSAYHDRVFVVLMSGNGAVMKFCKTRKGAEGYISRHSTPYYDDYTQRMVSTSYDVVELDASDIHDPRNDRRPWYAWLKEVNGLEYMYRNVESTAQHMEEIDPDVLQFVRECLADMGPTGGLRVIEEYEHQERPEEIAEAPEDHETPQADVQDAQPSQPLAESEGLDVSVNYNSELSGIELTFSDKPSEELREQLKAHGFRWSRGQGLWYARDSAERRQFVETLTSAEATEEAAPIEYPEIDIDDLHTYTVDRNLQAAEHAGHWLFRSGEHDRTAEIQAILREKQTEVEQLLALTEDPRLVYRLKKTLQSYKRRYYANYTKRLRNQANNPSWAVTGRSGRNARRDRKMSDAYDSMMREAIQIDKDYESEIYTLRNLIGREKVTKTRERAEAVNVDDIEFTVGRESITMAGLTETVRTYRAGPYMICKTWACFRIFKNGREVHSMRTTDTLTAAKKHVVMLLQQDAEKTQSDAAAWTEGSQDVPGGTNITHNFGPYTVVKSWGVYHVYNGAKLIRCMETDATLEDTKEYVEVLSREDTDGERTQAGA